MSSSRIHSLFTMTNSSADLRERKATKPEFPGSGGARRDRTDDLKLAKLPLSQLSYGPVRHHGAMKLVGLGGFEPPTSRLSSARSNQLSYRPKAEPRKVSRPAKDHVSPRLALAQNTPETGPDVPSIQRIRPEKKEKRRRQSSACRSLTGFFCSKKRSIRSKLREVLYLRKEVIQPQVPLRLPCYDFTPVAEPTVVACLLAVSATPSGKPNSHGVTGGVYKARERIHRGMLIHDY